MTNCRNCNNEISENFCPNCGQPAKLKRIDKHYISHEILHLLHFEKGFLYTVKELLLRPGNTIREFINENRQKNMKPVAFLIFTSLIFTLTAYYFHVDKTYNEQAKLQIESSSINGMMQWVQTHYGYANIMQGIFIAFILKLFFRKYKYNFFEIIILLCFVMGQGMLLLTIENLFFGLLSAQAYQIILVIISFGYTAWAIGQFFDPKKLSSYLKAFLAYLLGYSLFYVAVAMVGLTVDLIIKL